MGVGERSRVEVPQSGDAIRGFVRLRLTVQTGGRRSLACRLAAEAALPEPVHRGSDLMATRAGEASGVGAGAAGSG